MWGRWLPGALKSRDWRRRRSPTGEGLTRGRGVHADGHGSWTGATGSLVLLTSETAQEVKRQTPEPLVPNDPTHGVRKGSVRTCRQRLGKGVEAAPGDGKSWQGQLSSSALSYFIGFTACDVLMTQKTTSSSHCSASEPGGLLTPYRPTSWLLP